MFSSSPAAIYSSCIVLPILCIGAVSLRLWVRNRQAESLGADDWLQIPSLCLFIALAIVGLIGVTQHAYGYVWSKYFLLLLAEANIFQKLEYTMFFITSVLLSTIKISALFFFRRIFRLAQTGWLRHFVAGLIVLQVMWCTAFIFGNIFKCGTSQQWGSNIASQSCVRAQTKYNDAFAISDWNLDLTVLVVPMILIWRLEMSLKKKFAVSFVFMLALLGFAVSTARLVIWVRADKQLQEPNYEGSPQAEGALGSQAFWLATVEAGSALLSVNLPLLWVPCSQVATAVLRSCRKWSRYARQHASWSSIRGRRSDEEHLHGTYVQESKNTSPVQPEE